MGWNTCRTVFPIPTTCAIVYSIRMGGGGGRAVQAVNTKVKYNTKSKVEGQINHEVKPSAYNTHLETTLKF